MMMSRPTYLTIIVTVLLGLFVVQASHVYGEGQYQGESTISKLTMVTKPKGVKRKKGRKTRKTSDLPRHRIKRTPHTAQKWTPAKEQANNQDESKEKEEIPHETIRKLQKERQKNRSFKQQGVGRGAERQAGRGGAGETADNGGFTRPARGNIPMRDWDWGTVWVDPDLSSQGRGRPAATGTASATGTGERGRPAANRGRGAGRISTVGNVEPADEDESSRGTGRVASGGRGSTHNGASNNNPFVGEEKWRNQFVARLTPRPTRRPTTKPPTPRPTPNPTPKIQTLSGNADPTPIPTPAPVPGQAQRTCQLCPGGKPATYMTRTLIGTSISCQDVANTLATAEDCPMQKDMLPVDIEAYCGCPGMSFKGSCSFCPSGKENIWHNISIPALNHWTCQDVEDYCGFITNTAACSEMSPIADLCCGTWEEYWAYGDDDWDDDGTER